MKGAVLAILLLAQEDKGADLVYQAMTALLRDAKTVRAEYSVSVGANGRKFGVMSASLRLKGKDLWAMEFALKDELGRGRQDRSVSLLSDGRKVVVTGGTAPPGLEALKPEAVAEEIRSSLSTSMLAQAVFLEPGGRGVDGKKVERGPVASGGKETLDGRETLILEYTLKYDRAEFGGQPMAVKLWIDAKTKLPVKREVGFLGVQWIETFSVLKIDEEIPDADFRFQSLRRLATARAGQVAESVRLYGKYTGRHPGTLEDLARRPASLEPEVFWPPGGFVLGGAVPKDPWGRPFELRTEGGPVRVVSLGEDGKGGEIQAPVPGVSRRAIGAPSERLEKQFTGRVQLHLLGAAVRAFQSAYGELPKAKSALWERPAWAEVWPEGGWLGGGTSMPLDPWGEPYRMITEAAYVRVQVSDPKARSVPFKSLTADELRRMEESARPRLTEAERRELGTVFDQLGDDDLETREKAQEKLQRLGPAAFAPLEERIKVEKDKEAKLRLEAARDSIPPAVAPWKPELGGLTLSATAETGSAPGMSDERNAAASLKTLATAEADFRANDRDGNRVNDFWVGDVAGLYTLQDASGNSIKLIELSVALADGAPLEKGAAAGKYAAPSSFGEPTPRMGYHFRVMTHDNSSGKSEPYATETGGTPNLGKVHNTSSFGFCTYPAEYGVGGLKTFIINEGNTIFSRDTQGEPVLEWPSDDELRKNWSKVD